MTRKVSRGTGSSEPNDSDELDGKPSLGRRALLTRGGVVAAGVVGAGAVATAMAGPASAQATTAVDMNTANQAGTSATPTEIDADNDLAPTLILNNTGTDTDSNASPALQLTPSTASGGVASSLVTDGGYLTTTSIGTYAGELWFTHNFSTTSTPDIVPAPVHTEATANVYAQLLAPSRVLDTRTASLRTNIVNPSGNLNSAGQLLAGKTIAINLDGLVYFAEAVFANVTVVDQAAGGFVTVWSGATALPNASTINFGPTGALSNFLASGISEYSTSILNVIAIHTTKTTHVILDVAGFAMPGFEYAKFTVASPNEAKSARLRRAQQAMRKAKRA
jgi:hypothetical protein